MNTRIAHDLLKLTLSLSIVLFFFLSQSPAQCPPHAGVNGRYGNIIIYGQVISGSQFVTTFYNTTTTTAHIKYRSAHVEYSCEVPANSCEQIVTRADAQPFIASVDYY
jgi:hypothetical protein